MLSTEKDVSDVLVTLHCADISQKLKKFKLQMPNEATAHSTTENHSHQTLTSRFENLSFQVEDL